MEKRKPGRPKRVSVPYEAEAEVFNKAILASRLSPREIAYRFGRPEDKIREMMEGRVRPDLLILRGIGG
jgi:hypothetical protein